MAPGAGAAQLTVDLDALIDNYRRLCAEAGPSEVAGVVKADGFGLGAVRVAAALWTAGCRSFFVARIDEGVELRPVLPEAELIVLDGVAPGTEDAFVEHELVPVINSLEQLWRWQTSGGRSVSDRALPTILHVDTGMQRLGMSAADALTAAKPHRRNGLDVRIVMSHLASADETASDLSERQLAAFQRVRDILPMGRASLANSAGLFRGPEFRFDLIRSGYALFGGDPRPEQPGPNPMRPVVTVEAPVLQVRRAQPADTVGYGAGYTITRPSRLATVAVGYADGFLRSGSNRSGFVLDGQRLPVLGRVSMDLVTVDATDFQGDIGEGTMVEVIGPSRTIDEVAADAGTIGYEILTSLGNRYHRRYLGPSEPAVE